MQGGRTGRKLEGRCGNRRALEAANLEPKIWCKTFREIRTFTGFQNGLDFQELSEYVCMRLAERMQDERETVLNN